MLISLSEFENSSIKLIPCSCKYCQNIFMVERKYITREIKTKKGTLQFCSKRCQGKDHTKYGKTLTICCQCCCAVTRINSAIEKSKTKKFFCSHSCSATYSNTHKTTSIRRSKLEQLIEQAIAENFFGLECLFNDKTTIGSELDIYIPSLKLAFELNGLFHYEPIFGIDKLNKIQINDENKFQKCQKYGISLCVIDTSQHKYVTKNTSQKYIDIVINVIRQHISNFSSTSETSSATLTNVQVV